MVLGLEIEAAEVSVSPLPARGAQENVLVWVYFAGNTEAVDSARRFPVALLCMAAVVCNTP